MMGDGTLKWVIKTLLDGLEASFGMTESNNGRFITTGAQVASWLRKAGTCNVLILQDDRCSTKAPSSFSTSRASISVSVKFLKQYYLSNPSLIQIFEALVP